MFHLSFTHIECIHYNPISHLNSTNIECIQYNPISHLNSTNIECIQYKPILILHTLNVTMWPDMLNRSDIWGFSVFRQFYKEIIFSNNFKTIYEPQAKILK